jgi:hypothetical protein
MPCDFCVLRARSLVFLSLFGFTNQQYTSNTKFSYFIFFYPGRTGMKEFKKGDSQTKDRKTPKTRRKRLSFGNGLGTVRGVYVANTIAHRTPRALAVTTVGGTCGVLKTSFWPNIASSLPTHESIGFPELYRPSLRRVFLRYVNISTRIFGDSVSCMGLYCIIV